jgi:osmotically-inducible protein OsmY
MRNTFRGWLMISSILFFSAAIVGCGVGGRAADEVLAQKVKRALYDHGEANLLRVDVSVEHGVVYLIGETDDGQQKCTAEQIARRIADGAKVMNKVLVEP